MSDSLETQWLRAMRGQDGQQSAIRILAAKATTRDVHPTRGSHAILQAAQSGAQVRKTVSLNVRHADGTQGPIFCWGVAPFGWGKGEWE